VIEGSDDVEDAASPRDPNLDSLDQRIAKAREAEQERTGGGQAEKMAVAVGARTVATTLVGFPLGGIVIGFGLDKLLGTTPWLTIGLMFAAFIAACYQVMTKVRS
jgi:ATP synthase protein I